MGQTGISEEKIRNLHDYRGNDLFAPLEQLVLEYIEQIILERRTDPGIEVRLRRHFDDQERVELALIGNLWNMTNRLFNSWASTSNRSSRRRIGG